MLLPTPIAKALALVLTSSVFANAMTVKTSSGTLEGHSRPWHPDVEEFLGIPFAQPPIGDLRFAPPKKYASNDTITADKYGATCIQPPEAVDPSQPENWQNIARGHQVYLNNTSEDCLNLNVWASTKKAQTCPQPLKPVLMYFYGGGFRTGSGNDASYNGAAFAQEQDVVIVTFNYRLGIFGFSGAPGLSQNVALLDQRMAVEWVRDNIRAFGGDPCKITIFGHSAGGASVDFYDFAFYQDPIIAGVIPMSGSVNAFGRRLANTSEAGFSETAKLLGCAASSQEDVLACVRKADPARLLAASLNATKVVASQLDDTGKLYVGITGLFGPTIDNKTVFANYTDRVTAGQLSRVPMIAGFNTDEACFFAQTGAIKANATVEAAVNEVVFSCPMQWDALWRAEAGVPAWKYLYEGSYPNLYAPVCPGKPWHGQEMFVIFNSSEASTGFPATPAELAGGQYWRTAYATFAADPAKGLVDMTSPVQWPMFTTATRDQVVSLGGNGTFEAVVSDAVWTTPCYGRFRNGAPNF